MATGEGSRGGKIIGHTKSGKPVYDSASRRIGSSANVGANIGQTAGTLAHIAASIGANAPGKIGKISRAAVSIGWTKTAALGAGAGAVLGGGLAAVTGGELEGPGLTSNPFAMAVVGIGAYKLGASALPKRSAKLSPAQFKARLSEIGKSVDRNLNIVGRGIRKEGNVIHADFGSRNPFKKGK